MYTVLHFFGPGVMQQLDTPLTPGQCFLLFFIQSREDCTVSQLADKMEVNPSAVTVMLDRLENHGFVKRSRSSHDRRVVTLSITPAGRRALEHVLQQRRKIVSHCLSQMPEEKVETFLSALENLAQIAEVTNVPLVLGSPRKTEE